MLQRVQDRDVAELVKDIRQILRTESDPRGLLALDQLRMNLVQEFPAGSAHLGPVTLLQPPAELQPIRVGPAAHANDDAIQAQLLRLAFAAPFGNVLLKVRALLERPGFEFVLECGNGAETNVPGELNVSLLPSKQFIHYIWAALVLQDRGDLVHVDHPVQKSLLGFRAQRAQEAVVLPLHEDEHLVFERLALGQERVQVELLLRDCIGVVRTHYDLAFALVLIQRVLKTLLQLFARPLDHIGVPSGKAVQGLAQLLPVLRGVERRQSYVQQKVVPGCLNVQQFGVRHGDVGMPLKRPPPHALKRIMVESLWRRPVLLRERAEHCMVFRHDFLVNGLKFFDFRLQLHHSLLPLLLMLCFVNLLRRLGIPSHLARERGVIGVHQLLEVQRRSHSDQGAQKLIFLLYILESP